MKKPHKPAPQERAEIAARIEQIGRREDVKPKPVTPQRDVFRRGKVKTK